jgi:integrase
VSELTNLRWEHVDLERGRLLVRNGEGFKTKSGQDRAVPLVGVAKRTLKDLRDSQSHDQPHVFVGAQGRKLCPQYVSKRFRHYRRMAGLPEEIHFHSLRHTCASWLAEKGVPLPVIQRVLGHSTISMTLRYAHLSPDVVQAEMLRALA